MQHANKLDLWLPIVNGFIGLILAFISCELGHRMTDAFVQINYSVDRFRWYLLPIEIKRMLPMVIRSAQEPISLECFGTTTCTRDVFKSVGISNIKSIEKRVDVLIFLISFQIVHTAFSCFMVLRELMNWNHLCSLLNTRWIKWVIYIQHHFTRSLLSKIFTPFMCFFLLCQH